MVFIGANTAHASAPATHSPPTLHKRSRASAQPVLRHRRTLVKKATLPSRNPRSSKTRRGHPRGSARTITAHVDPAALWDSRRWRYAPAIGAARRAFRTARRPALVSNGERPSRRGRRRAHSTIARETPSRATQMRARPPTRRNRHTKTTKTRERNLKDLPRHETSASPPSLRR